MGAFTDMGHKSRAQRQRQRLRSAERLARLLGPHVGEVSSESEESSTTSSSVPSSGPRTLSFRVRGGWVMSFKMSGVRVPVDMDTEPEKQHIVEKTLAEVLRRSGGQGGGGDEEGEA